MKFAIAGMGVAGSTLARILLLSGYEVECFDPKRKDYYPPCGWAVNEHEFSYLLSKIGVDGSQYVITRASKVSFRNSRRSVSFPSSGLCTIDKKRFLTDMAWDIEVSHEQISTENYDLVFDCTGVSRAYIGSSPDDFTMKAVEALSDRNVGNTFEFSYYSRGRGYGWIFPLGELCHVGSGSDSFDLNSYVLAVPDKIRLTGRNIRLKPLFHQSVHDNIVAVGESAGTVSPITGEGIVPSMKNAFLVSKLLKELTMEKFLALYPAYLMEEFIDYIRLFSLLKNARAGSLIKFSNITKIGAVLKDFRSFGICINLRTLLRALI